MPKLSETVKVAAILTGVTVEEAREYIEQDFPGLPAEITEAQAEKILTISEEW